MVYRHYRFDRLSILKLALYPKGSDSVEILDPEMGVALTKHDVISMLIKQHTYTKTYIIKEIISCSFHSL